MKVTWICFVAVCLSCSKGGGSSDAPKPKASINDASKTEGNGGTGTFTFSVTLDRAYGETVTITYSTTEGTAKAGDDFTAALNQSITFQANEVQKNISIPMVADNVRE